LEVRFDSFAAFVRFCLKISRIFPRKIPAIFLLYISERPADFAKATTAKENGGRPAQSTKGN